MSDWPYLCIKTNTLETQCKQWPPRSRQLLWSSDLCRELRVRLLGRPIYPACFSFTRSRSLRPSQKGNKLHKSPLVRKTQSAHKSDRGWHVFSPTRKAAKLLCRPAPASHQDDFFHIVTDAGLRDSVASSCGVLESRVMPGLPAFCPPPTPPVSVRAALPQEAVAECQPHLYSRRRNSASGTCVTGMCLFV